MVIFDNPQEAPVMTWHYFAVEIEGFCLDLMLLRDSAPEAMVADAKSLTTVYINKNLVHIEVDR